MAAELNPDTLSSLRRLSTDFEVYAATALRIRTKEGGIAPLTLNQAQQHIHRRLEAQIQRTGKVRALVLKGRQQGCSTYVEGRFFWRAAWNSGKRVFILTHEDAASANLFEMAQRYLEHLPKELRPSVESQNAKELTFKALDSGYKVGTAGNKAVGRSATVQYFHGSEVAFWPNADQHAAGVIQTVADLPGTEIILESTANGVGNYFHTQWQKAERGESDFEPIFVPWFWQSEYRKPVPADFVPTAEENEYAEAYGLDTAQLVWRRSKIADLSVSGGDGSWRFRQEYPANPTEAFQSSGDETLIKPEQIVKARKDRDARESGPLLIGVDPARFGDDRTSIIRRRGRVAFNLESHRGKDTMEVAGLVVKMIRDEKPARVFVDVGGLGAGVVDRLRELGYADKIEAVNFGEKALDADKYANKRAECWGLMAKWVGETPVRIPDTDTLHSDLTAPKYKYDSNSRLVIEKKEDIKKRGLASPDEADALALTFAVAVSDDVAPRDPYAGFRRTYG